MSIYSTGIYERPDSIEETQKNISRIAEDVKLYFSRAIEDLGSKDLEGAEKNVKLAKEASEKCDAILDNLWKLQRH